MWIKRRVLWAVGAVLVAVLAGVAIAVTVHSHSAPDASPTTRPATGAPSATVVPTSPSPSPGADLAGPLNLLILGVDTRVTVPGWQPHSDAIMILHVEPGLKSAYLFSLPRDLRVAMPKFAPAGFPGGTYKITEAMSRGSRVPGSTTANVPQGYRLLTETISAYTGIKQFQAGAILNFGGLQSLTDQLGGVDIDVDETVKSHHREPNGSMRPLKPGGGDYTGPQKVYRPGEQHLVGWEAIDYARQRYGLPNGDYDRQRHQRQIILALLEKARSQGLTTDAGKLQGIISTLGKMLVYVGGDSPVDYAYALRDLTPASITLVGLPGGGVTSGGTYLGEALKPEGRAFLTAVAQDRVAAYLAAHPKLISK